MFIKIAAPDLGPVLLVTLRLYLGGLLFLPFLLQKKYLKLFKSHFNSIFILAIMNNALPFTMFAYASLGANSNRLTSTINNLDQIRVNLQASKGRIMDTNFAAETSNLARSQILQQAATAMLAQANASKQTVLTLIR